MDAERSAGRHAETCQGRPAPLRSGKPWRFAEDFHVCGFEWLKDELRWYIDGVLVRTVQNTHWHQPLHLIFDSETMPEWFGMPNDDDLPSNYSIEYVRAWTQKEMP